MRMKSVHSDGVGGCVLVFRNKRSRDGIGIQPRTFG